MRKMPQIPRNVFFGGTSGDEQSAAAPAPAARRPVEEDKVQVTVYLSPATAKRLEAVRFHLLDDHNVKVSKSAIAEYAICQIGEDLSVVAEFFGVGER